jgi:hypothetical protein
MTKRTITVRIKQQPRALVRVTEVSFDLYEDIVDFSDSESEPSAVIGRKAEAIAELLGCSYEQAERIVFGFSE